MNKNNEILAQLLNPVVLRDKIISASMFLIAYEILIESIVGRIKYFYSGGLNERDLKINEEYVNEVLTLNKSPIYASLEWLKSNEVITEVDLQKFERVKLVRNALAHELSTIVTKGADFNHIKSFDEVIELIRKVEVWWVINFEMAINSDFDGKEIDEEGIVPGPILSIQMMIEVLSGNEHYFNMYKEISTNKAF